MRRFLLILLIILLAGCTTAAPAGETPSPIPPTPTPIPIPTEDTADPPADGPVTLRIWLPPEFDPANGSPAGEILQAQLDEFTARRPNVIIETRLKDVYGPGGMIDTLSTAAAAAPLAIPDLVALPRAALENAAIKGLLYPYDGLTTSLDEPDWYDFARQFAHLQGSVFGLPFAGDALIMVYRPASISDPPADWSATLGITETLSFPAADPASLFTLALYQSTGGVTLDEEDRPTLDTIQLTDVYTYYRQAGQTGLMPFWLTQYETDAQSWEGFETGQANMVITWASRYLQNPPADGAAAPIPTTDGVHFTIADGWGWALSSPNPDHQLLGTQLAEFLTNSEFLAEWSAAAGYLPPRPSALASWNNIPLQSLASQIATSARLIPSQNVLTTISPALQLSTLSVLKEEVDPVTAAENAVQRLLEP